MTGHAKSYGEILRSSAMIGGSQVVVIAIGIVRTKAMAVLLGPAGFGLMGVYNAFADLATSLGSLGLGGSGVRQVAAAAAEGNSSQVARTVAVLKILCVIAGLVGAAAIWLCSTMLSDLTFGSPEYGWAIGLLGIAVLFRVVSAGQVALIQGTRRITEFALIGFVSAALGTAVSIPIVWSVGDAGIVPSIVAVAAASLAATWWYSKRIPVERCRIDVQLFWQEAKPLIGLGAVFMASGVLMMSAAYAVRIMVLKAEGPAAAGFYHAGWLIAGMYVGVVLQAMGADFYPRLTGVSSNNYEVNRLVNEQTLLGVLLSAPGVIATLGFAPIGLKILYSEEFVAAAELLRWLGLGMAIRVVSWPLGYILLARSERLLFFATELAWTIVNVGLAWFLIGHLGVLGAGVAFLGSYVFHLVMVAYVARHLTGFRWTTRSLCTAAAFLGLSAAVHLASTVLPAVTSALLSLPLCLLVAWVCGTQIIAIAGIDAVPARLRPLFRSLGLAR